MKLQLKMFMEIVRQQSLIPVLRSYLKLYQTIPISKLADYLEMSEEEVWYVSYFFFFENFSQTFSLPLPKLFLWSYSYFFIFSTQLINWKSRSQQVGGPSSMGKGETAEIHFWIEKVEF